MKDPFYNATEEHYTKCYFCGNELDEESFTIDDEFDETLVEKRKLKERKMQEYFNKKAQEIFKQWGFSDTPEKPVIKCPTCGSTNVSKISTAKKAVGFATVGVFSSNFGKTMECKKCGYKW